MIKLSKYIEELNKLLKKEGDVDCFYAADEEGNSYKKVNYTGTIYFLDIQEFKQGDISLISKEDFEEKINENPELINSYKKVIIIN